MTPRVPALLLLSTVCAFGQFSDLSATDDGSVVYFSTSLRMQTELSQNFPGTPAIYRVNADASVERVSTPQLGVNQISPQVSSDGTVVAYTGTIPCFDGSACLMSYSPPIGYLVVNGKPYGQGLTGTVEISRNGRYEWNFGGGKPFNGLPYTVNELRDLTTGAVINPQVTPVGGQLVTADGRVLGTAPGTGLQLWSTQGSQTVATAEPVYTAEVDDAGARVVYQTANCQNPAATCRLHAVDVKSGSDTLVAQVQGGPLEFSLSRDGSLVLYVPTSTGGFSREAWLAHTDGSGAQQLTSFPEGVDHAFLSGSATTIIAATAARLVRIDVGSGAITELIGRTPVCTSLTSTLVPGSLAQMSGIWLPAVAQVAAAPLPTQLGGVGVLVDGVLMPLLSAGPDQIWFQVPFEQKLEKSATVQLDHVAVFEGCYAHAGIVARLPQFFPQSSYWIAAHQDFSGLVSPNSPARPNEIVHTYALGLGGVNPPLQTAAATPVGPLYTLADPFDCEMLPGASALNVPFAGLAPGMIGIYQVDIQMPSTLPSGTLFLSCGTPGNFSERETGYISTAPR
jgi:uncharacterized protein (TIGR03437 family)